MVEAFMNNEKSYDKRSRFEIIINFNYFISS